MGHLLEREQEQARLGRAQRLACHLDHVHHREVVVVRPALELEIEMLYRLVEVLLDKGPEQLRVQKGAHGGTEGG